MDAKEEFLELSKKLELTNVELADYLGITKESVSRMRSGVHKVPKSVLLALKALIKDLERGEVKIEDLQDPDTQRRRKTYSQGSYRLVAGIPAVGKSTIGFHQIAARAIADTPKFGDLSELEKIDLKETPLSDPEVGQLILNELILIGNLVQNLNNRIARLEGTSSQPPTKKTESRPFETEINDAYEALAVEGHSSKKRTRRERAVKKLRKALEKDPKNINVGQCLAQVYRTLGMLPEAIEVLSSIIRFRELADIAPNISDAALLYSRAGYYNLRANELSSKDPVSEENLRASAFTDLKDAKRIGPQVLGSVQSDPDFQGLFHPPTLRSIHKILPDE